LVGGEAVALSLNPADLKSARQLLYQVLYKASPEGTQTPQNAQV